VILQIIDKIYAYQWFVNIPVLCLLIIVKFKIFCISSSKLDSV